MDGGQGGGDSFTLYAISSDYDSAAKKRVTKQEQLFHIPMTCLEGMKANLEPQSTVRIILCAHESELRQHTPTNRPAREHSLIRLQFIIVHTSQRLFEISKVPICDIFKCTQLPPTSSHPCCAFEQHGRPSEAIPFQMSRRRYMQRFFHDNNLKRHSSSF